MPAPVPKTEVANNEGWGVLHLFAQVSPDVDRAGVEAAVKAASSGDGQVVPVAVLGHKADLAFMALAPDWWRLRQLQTELAAAGLRVVDSYLSMTEVSEYAQGMPAERLAARLYPELPPPDKPAFCFYPMSKRRTAGANWYTLDYDDRAGLMGGHGAVGRTFAGRVTQLITGSTGVDDHEWGVTLFASRPEDLKDVVYTMRFDEASAVYAEFGRFYTGLVASLDEVLNGVGL